ncbi:MAG: DUF6624 domain-containing protein [Gemmatimonadales bacterium]|nr:hypothetical protein [Planctomycetota bacterium]
MRANDTGLSAHFMGLGVAAWAMVCLSACLPAEALSSQVVDSASLRVELLNMLARDQRARNPDSLLRMSDSDRERAVSEAMALAAVHGERLKSIVAAVGWPTPALVGEDGVRAAFTLLQHADHDPEFQERMLPLLQDAAYRGETPRRDVAYLTDRIRRWRGRPQVYGTQYDIARDRAGREIRDANGRPTYLAPLVEDLADLDARRATMDLGPWIEYEYRMARLQNRAPFERARTPQDSSDTR